MTGLLTGHHHLKGHLFKLGMVDSSRCDRFTYAYETASYVLCGTGSGNIKIYTPGPLFLETR